MATMEANMGLFSRRTPNVVSWGNNDSGQTKVPSRLVGVTAIAAGQEHSLALTPEGVHRWGGLWFAGDAAARLEQPGRFLAIAAGDAHSLALREDGTVLAWGGNVVAE